MGLIGALRIESLLLLGLVAHVPLTCSLQPLEEGFHYDVDETTVTVGHQHACVLEVEPGVDFGGRPRCWGNKRFKRLEVVNDIFIQISAGEFGTCGVSLDERVRCWGEHTPNPPQSMSFLQVSCGSYHCCGVQHTGELFCWGADFMGQLKYPRGKFVQVSSGLTHVCALAHDGTASCWGDDAREATSPPDTQFLQLSCRSHECCGIRLSDSKIVCWGGNLPEGTPFHVWGDDNEAFTQVSLGNEFFCGIREDMTLRCWGKRAIVNGMPDSSEQVLIVSAGTKQVCAILARDSKLYCWGVREGAPEGIDPAL